MVGCVSGFGRPLQLVVACAALGAGAVAAFGLMGSKEVAPMLALALAIVCGICKTTTT